MESEFATRWWPPNSSHWRQGRATQSLATSRKVCKRGGGGGGSYVCGCTGLSSPKLLRSRTLLNVYRACTRLVFLARKLHFTAFMRCQLCYSPISFLLSAEIRSWLSDNIYQLVVTGRNSMLHLLDHRPAKKCRHPQEREKRVGVSPREGCWSSLVRRPNI